MYKRGYLSYTSRPDPSALQYKSKFKKHTLITPGEFEGSSVWSRDGVLFASGYNVYSGDNYQYIYDNGEWKNYNWEGFQNIAGYDVWKAYGNYYYSTYVDGSFIHYKLVGNRWESYDPGYLEFVGNDVWSVDDDHVFVTRNNTTYRFSELSEKFTVARGLQGIPDGTSVWSDGDRIYYSDSKILDNSNNGLLNNNFIDYKWNVPTILRIFSYGGNVYDIGMNNILVGNAFLPYSIPFPDDILRVLAVPQGLWSDGNNIYISVRGNYGSQYYDYSYVLEPVTATDFDHELPYTANTVTINLYMNNSEKNVIGKSLTSVRNLNGTFKQEADITNLSIQVDLSSVPNFNYIRVPLFNRYYFVDNIVNIRDDLWEISCHVDVLESFKDTIMSTYGLIERNEFEFNPKIIDHLRVIEQGVTTEVLTDGMTLETVLNDGVSQTMTETSPRFMLVGTFMNLEGEIL